MPTMILGPITLCDKPISELELNEGTFPSPSGRYNGVSVGRDQDGFFVFTHRARSDSYDQPSNIPDSVIEYIESTG